MSISVSFYNNLSDNRDMNKTLAPIGEEPVVCQIYEPCDVLNPILLVDIDNIDIANTNYCIIAGFARNYFITNIVPDNAKRVKLYCHVDVLSTYDEYIRSCPVIAARSSNQPNYFLEDNMRLFNAYVKNQYINIGNKIGYPDTTIVITLSN